VSLIGQSRFFTGEAGIENAMPKLPPGRDVRRFTPITCLAVVEGRAT